MRVRVLATVRNLDLIPAATLVFKTLRTGFPSAEVTVQFNGMDDSEAMRLVGDAASKAEVDHFYATAPTIHHEWIQSLLASEHEPFYLLDTDVVFWSSVEGWKWEGAPLAGRYIPQFLDSFTKCVTRPRLHTSLLYVDPLLVRSLAAKYLAQFPDTPFNPKPNLVFPCFFPRRCGQQVRSIFHDTCCLLYQAIGGVAFEPANFACYDHLNFGTISDIVAPHYPELRFRESHFAIFENPELARGAWKGQERFYAERAV